MDYLKSKKHWETKGTLSDDYICNISVGLTSVKLWGNVAKYRHKIETLALDNALAKLNFKKNSFIELGCGSGRWVIHYSQQFKVVTAVDFSKSLLNILKKEIKKRKIKNISVFYSDIRTFKFKRKYDVIYLSGVTQYISDNDMYNFLKSVSKYLTKNGFIITRDSLSTGKRVFSKNENYPCIYRSKNEFLNMFEKYGFHRVIYFKPRKFQYLNSLIHYFFRGNVKLEAKLREFILKNHNSKAIALINFLSHYLLIFGYKLRRGNSAAIADHDFNIFKYVS
ncbi:MAG: methyltransferase domain-containing protein [Promethearchaeota archaeon]